MTYSGPTGESNIDVTLAGNFLAGVGLEWRVSDRVATGDHNLILFLVGSRRAGWAAASTPREAAFDLRHADWSRLQELIGNSFAVEILGELNLRETNSGTKKLENLLAKLCEGVIPRRKSRHNAVPWWN